MSNAEVVQRFRENLKTDPAMRVAMDPMRYWGTPEYRLYFQGAPDEPGNRRP